MDEVTEVPRTFLVPRSTAKLCHIQRSGSTALCGHQDASFDRTTSEPAGWRLCRRCLAVSEPDSRDGKS
jgi:hypothetical protein